MAIPGLSFKDTALQLISQGKTPENVSDVISKLKEQFASDENMPPP